MVESGANMTASSPTSNYVLGSTDAEHERLIWQAARVAPITERLFREAGIGPGQRVLDIGSGVGDVAMLAARLVGPSGKVVGIERDPKSITKARARVAEAGLDNVSFTQSDVGEIPDGEPFDAAVGRFILMFLPDPVAALRSLSRLVRPGGVLAFHEPSWAPALARLAPLPLWSATASIIHETFLRTGANPEMGPDLYQKFQEAGLPAPTMRMEMPLGKEPDFAQWFYDIFCTLRPQMQQLHLPIESLGSLDTLVDRLQAEVAGSRTVGCWIAVVGAWSRKP
jgi:ubiquinone/menaquinone biosynthesis C-methylase UbiE